CSCLLVAAFFGTALARSRVRLLVSLQNQNRIENLKSRSGMYSCSLLTRMMRKRLESVALRWQLAVRISVVVAIGWGSLPLMWRVQEAGLYRRRLDESR